MFSFYHRIGAIYIAGESYSIIFQELEGKSVFTAISLQFERITIRELAIRWAEVNAQSLQS